MYSFFLIFLTIPFFLQSMDLSESEWQSYYDDLIKSILASPDLDEKSDIKFVAPRNSSPFEIHQEEAETKNSTQNTITATVEKEMTPSKTQPQDTRFINFHMFGELKCKFCDRTFSSEQRLERHTQLCHREKVLLVSYRCDKETCNLAFRSAAGLSNHKRAHWEQKLICNECGKHFKLNGSLNNHLKKKHQMSNNSSLKNIEDDNSRAKSTNS